MQYFGSTNSPAASPDADPDGDGQNNLAEFLSGSDPTNSVSALRIISLAPAGADMVITWQTAGGKTNAVQALTGNGYTNDLADISPAIFIAGSGGVVTNYTDAGGATNTPSRFYRIRLVP
jgi:hypothetical protein